ncbi:MAG: phosphoribosylglycinamide formyltransferase [Bacteroidales bacterium]
MTNIAIFASGNGTNAESIIRYFQHHPGIRTALVVCNKPDAGVLKRAARYQIPTKVFPSKVFKEDPEQILRILKTYNIDFIALAGFMLLLPKKLVYTYPDKIVNIHPALLPAYGGKGMYGDFVHQAVLDAKESHSGISIHYVNEDYDDGNIIFQASCPVTPKDTVASLAKKVHALEHEHYPRVIEHIITQQQKG